MEFSSQDARLTDWKALSDSELRDAAIRRGPDREVAWMVLVRRHRQAVTRAIEGVLSRNGKRPEGSVVEDLVQATWTQTTKRNGRKLRLWKPERASLGTLLAKIGMGEALTWCRFRSTRREVMMDPQSLHELTNKADTHFTPEQAAWLNEAENMVRAWEADLEESERALLRLWRDGRYQAAIAAALNRSQQFVSRSLRSLKAILCRLTEDMVS